MTRKINLSHPMMRFTRKVQEICEPFLKANSLSYFQFRRNYGNGKFIFLSNNIEPFLEGMQKKYLYNPFFERKKTETYGSVYMVNDVAPPIIVSFAEDKYKIYNIITLVRSCEQYCDSFSFGLSEKCDGAASYYASILKDLQTFATQFLLSARPLLNGVEKNPIYVPMHAHEDTFLPPYNAGGYEITGRFGKILLTHDEFVFLHLLHKGKTKSEVAKILAMPVHKIDSDITLLTQKTGYPLFLLKPSIITTSFEIVAYLPSPFWNEAACVHEDLVTAL